MPASGVKRTRISAEKPVSATGSARRHSRGSKARDTMPAQLDPKIRAAVRGEAQKPTIKKEFVRLSRSKIQIEKAAQVLMRREGKNEQK